MKLVILIFYQSSTVTNKVWFGRVALLVILFFCRELLFVCNQKSRHSRRRAARGVLASFSWGSFSIFFSIFGLVARAFHSTFSTSAANLMQEAITGATATIIYGLRIYNFFCSAEIFATFFASRHFFNAALICDFCATRRIRFFCFRPFPEIALLERRRRRGAVLSLEKVFYFF